MWTTDDVEKIVRLSPSGSTLLDICKSENTKIESRSRATDQHLNETDASGYFDPKTNTIVLNERRTLDSAICTLAHEAEHIRQFRDKEALNPAETTKKRYVESVFRNEEKAETRANQVAYELREQGYGQGPLASQSSPEQNSSFEQAIEYRVAREHDKLSHNEAAKTSEPLWSKNKENKAEYEKDALKEWNKANPNAAHIPKARDTDEATDAWDRKMQAQQDAVRIKSVEPPAEGQSHTLGRSR